MSSPATVQQALRLFFDPEGLDTQRRKVCSHLLACHTEAMGETVLRCDNCAQEQHNYHSCRDRHCPQCQGRATRLWVERQREAVLPVAYYHLVFTLPHTLNGWLQLHPQVLYRRLFECAWSTLKAFGQDPKRLGGQLGMSAVLHTWGQTLDQHVHLHCLVPGGALSEAGQWKPAKGNYLFPVKALSRHFRGAMVSALRESANAGELKRVTRPGEINRLLDALMQQKWVVYTKHCLTHTQSVVEYLGRYTHRIAITDARLLTVDEQGVVLRYKDYRDGGKSRSMHLAGKEFVRRYLLHVLPKGFTRIRHYGFLAGCCRVRKVAQIRAVLASEKENAANDQERKENHSSALDIRYRCPRCKTGHLCVVAELAPRPMWKVKPRRQ
jgi:hypothetical protein